jgi:hypothetical protein
MGRAGPRRASPCGRGVRVVHFTRQTRPGGLDNFSAQGPGTGWSLAFFARKRRDTPSEETPTP